MQLQFQPFRREPFRINNNVATCVWIRLYSLARSLSCFRAVVECTVTRRQSSNALRRGNASWHARYEQANTAIRKTIFKKWQRSKGKCFATDINIYIYKCIWPFVHLHTRILDRFSNGYGNGASGLAEDVDDVLFRAAFQLFTVNLIFKRIVKQRTTSDGMWMNLPEGRGRRLAIDRLWLRRCCRRWHWWPVALQQTGPHWSLNGCSILCLIQSSQSEWMNWIINWNDN